MLKYYRKNNHDIFNRIEINTDVEGIVMSIKGISNFVDYEYCKGEGIALSKKLLEKYSKGKLNEYSFFYKEKKTGREATGGCAETPYKTRSKNKHYIYYKIEDFSLRHDAKMKYKSNLEKKSEKNKSKYSDL